MLKNIWDKILYFGQWVLNFFTRVRKRLKKDYDEFSPPKSFTSIKEIKQHLRGEALSFFAGGLKSKASGYISKYPTGGLMLSIANNPYEDCYRSSAFGDVNVVKTAWTCLKSFFNRKLFGQPFSLLSLKFPSLTFF